MKALIILCCVISFGFSPDTGYSQNAKILIEKDQILSVEEVFDLIREQTKYNFVFPSKWLPILSMVELKKGPIQVSALLDKSLAKKLIYEYLPEAEIIIIKPLSKKADDQKLITGKVTDDREFPLFGVSVIVKDAQRGTVTDEEGNYSISANDEDILVFTYIGFKTEEVLVRETMGDGNIINLTLQQSISELDEVLLTTGFYTLPKERATGSFTSIKREQIEVPSSSIAERLVGMVPGLQSTVNPDGSVDFEIRGRTSLYADQKPLIVYDGFPIEGGFSSINPNDIESIVVLKDAAAASIWGAKSANGVIVIKSKNARKGEVRISGSSFVRFSDKLNLDYVNPWASSAEVIEYEQYGFNSDFFGGPWPPPSATVSSLDPQSLAVTAMNEARLGRITPGERDAILSQLRNLNNKEQIEEYLLQFPIINQYNVSVSGGNEKMGNYLSLMYEKNKDFYKGNEADKFLVHYKNGIGITNWLDFDFSSLFKYDARKNNGVNLGTIRSFAPYDMLVNEDGSLNDMSYLYYYSPNFNQFVPKEKFPYSDWSYNPISEIRNRELLNTDINARFQAGLTFKIIEGLELSTDLQYDMLTLKTRNYFDENSFEIRRFVNETSGWNRDINSVPIQNVPSGGVLQQNESKIKGYNFRNQLSFARNFADKHAINAIVGSEISDRVTEFTRNPDALGYDDDRLTTGELLNPVLTSHMWNGFPLSFSRFFYPFNLGATHQFTYNTDRFFSLYGNAAYTYNNKYTVSGSYRTDASNLITNDPKYRFSPFWSMGLGWQISEENFMQNYDWVDRLNVRFSFGYNGNIDKSTSFRPLISIPGTLNPYTEETIGQISSYGNPTLRWEKTNTVNLGLDFSILNNKLFGTFEIYQKESTDLIVSQSIPSVNGTTQQKFNNGVMVNKGIEVSLGTFQPIKGDDIIWDGNLNFAYNHNEITKFFKASYQMYDLYAGGTTSYVEGYNANTLWSLRYAGLTNIGTEADPNMQPSFYGENDEKLTFLDWPVGDARNYESNEGTTVAPYVVGMRNSFEIYNFDFSFIITAKFGHVFRRQSFNYPSMRRGNSYVNTQYSEVINSSPSEVAPIPEVEPRYFFWDRFYPYLDYLTADASHIRFQEINLSYSLPATIINKTGLNSVKVFAMANDVGTILFNSHGEDPEYPLGTLKPMARYTIGLNFTF